MRATRCFKRSVRILALRSRARATAISARGCWLRLRRPIRPRWWAAPRSDDVGGAADVLRGGADAVVIPTEDGGYALIGMRGPAHALFSEMHWSAPSVMAETRRRLRALGLTWQEPVTLWDVDLPGD